MAALREPSRRQQVRQSDLRAILLDVPVLEEDNLPVVVVVVAPCQLLRSPALDEVLPRMSAALQQVLEHLNSGDFYSAHQKARTTATRLLAPPRRNPPPAGSVLPYDKKAQEAAELLWDAARRLLEKGQVGSGVDLGVMLVDDVWAAREVGCGKDERGQSCVYCSGQPASCQRSRRRSLPGLRLRRP